MYEIKHVFAAKDAVYGFILYFFRWVLLGKRNPASQLFARTSLINARDS